MDNSIENEDNENEDSNEADSESFISSSSDNDINRIQKDKKLSKKQSNWDTTTKKYKADFEILAPQEKENKEDETIEKKAVEKSPRERFVRVFIT